MLKIERSLMWTYVITTGDNINHQLASGIASALGLTMQKDAEMAENDQFCYALLASNGEYFGAFYTDLHKQPTISLFLDYNSEQETKYNALGGESWLQNLLEKSVDKLPKN